MPDAYPLRPFLYAPHSLLGLGTTWIWVVDIHEPRYAFLKVLMVNARHMYISPKPTVTNSMLAFGLLKPELTLMAASLSFDLPSVVQRHAHNPHGNVHPRCNEVVRGNRNLTRRTSQRRCCWGVFLCLCLTKRRYFQVSLLSPARLCFFFRRFALV